MTEFDENIKSKWSVGRVYEQDKDYNNEAIVKAKPL